MYPMAGICRFNSCQVVLRTVTVVSDDAHGTRLVGWCIVIFCAVIGALIIVTPHQFSAPAYAALQPALVWWGYAFLGAGLSLILVAVLKPHRYVVVAAHGLAGGLLLMLASRFALAATWTAVGTYVAMGLGTVTAPFIGPLLARASQRRGHLLAVIMGVGATANGLVLLARPDQFTASTYDLIRPHLLWYGLGFTLAGAGLIA